MGSSFYYNSRSPDATLKNRRQGAFKWNRSPERGALIEKVRSMPPRTPVILESGEEGVITSTDERTLTVRVSVRGRPERGYNVSMVSKKQG